VSRVVPRAELESAARTVALEICSSSPVALRAAKRSIDAGVGVTLDEGLEIEQAAWSVVVASRDRAEGIASFNDKREARWSNS
jgi:enoyl-CoA hydratase/carnithine racemase